jgi:inosose dehydratase
VHIKDVSESLAASLRGELTGIAVSQCAIGDGVNRENIEKCIDILVDINYDGVVSLECEGQGGPMIEKSLAYVKGLVEDANKRWQPNNDFEFYLKSLEMKWEKYILA